MLVPALLQANLVSLFSAMKKSQMSESDYAAQLAAIITNYIKTAQVNPGIAVTTAGTAAAQTGATTAPGSLS